jgi:hypothetical protein
MKRRRYWKRDATVVGELLKRFGDVKLSEAKRRLQQEQEPKKAGRPRKWDDGIASDVHLMVKAIMNRGFGLTESQRMLAAYKHPKGRWFVLGEVQTGYEQGEAALADLSRKEIDASIMALLKEMPKLKAYIAGLKKRTRNSRIYSTTEGPNGLS